MDNNNGINRLESEETDGLNALCGTKQPSSVLERHMLVGRGCVGRGSGPTDRVSIRVELRHCDRSTPHIEIKRTSEVGLQLLLRITSILIPIRGTVWGGITGDAACACAAFGGSPVIVCVEERVLPIWGTCKRRFMRKDGKDIIAVIRDTVTSATAIVCDDSVFAG